MSIQKKSLISTLKTAKKANVASAPEKPSVESGARMGARKSLRLAKKTARLAARKVARYARPL